MRLATLLKPVMDSITADMHYFFVPNRLVWDNWEFFMGECKKPEDDPNIVLIPQLNIDLTIDYWTENLADYFGLSLFDVAAGQAETSVNTLLFRGYELIFNDWYRNQNVGVHTDVPTDDGPDEIDDQGFGLGTIKLRHKKGDYFTRALFWPQKGDPVFFPLGTDAPVVGNGAPTFNIGTTQNSRIGSFAGGDSKSVDFETHQYQGDDAASWNLPALVTDLSQATAATINDIRTAFQIQRLLERDARGGTRYIEILLSHFNVQSPDFRLQRPEYIGGGSSRIIINPVASTVATDDAPQGNLSAVGTGLLKAGMNHSFTEHGYLFALTSCRQDLTYQTGLDRIWSRQTRYDFYWPALSHLGEQQILNKEVHFDIQNADDVNDGTWGYQERYAEYRYQPGRITGKFRSNNPESLDVWHLSQDFEELPLLNISFLNEHPPIDRIVAVPSEPDLIVDIWHQITATRAMPVYAVPGLVDHF